MKTTLAMISVLVASVLCLPALAAAQGTVKTFDQLNTRLKIGNAVRVVDTEGWEVKGELLELHNTSITVEGEVPTTFEADRVRLIEHDTKSSRGPLLFGMLVGGAIGALVGAAKQADEGLAGVWWGCAAIGVGIGAGGGAIIGAARPAKWKEVYRAPGASGSARMSIAPVVSPHTKGIVLSFSF
jgi:hypothetical protein